MFLSVGLTTEQVIATPLTKANFLDKQDNNVSPCVSSLVASNIFTLSLAMVFSTALSAVIFPAPKHMMHKLSSIDIFRMDFNIMCPA